GPRGVTARTAAGLTLRYVIAAVAAFLLATGAVAWLADDLASHYYQPRILALAHVVALGWITLTILGASYQLMPIVLERPLWSERLARHQLPVLLAGLLGMVGHFALGRWAALPWAAGLVGLGLAAHLGNVALSGPGGPPWDLP